MRYLLPFALMLSSCAGWDVVSPSDEKEALAIRETSRFADLMGVKVHGEITDTLYLVGDKYSTAWYEKGVVFWYRPGITTLEVEKTAGKETISNVAAHEVCHAKYPKHDLAHWECMAKWATPTYPRP